MPLSLTRLDASKSVLPGLHQGHAPFAMHQAFDDALDAFEDWVQGLPQPVVGLDGQLVPISAVFGKMRSCTDLLPARIVETVRAVAGEAAGSLPEDQVTYAEGARLLRALCVDRLKG